MKKLNLILLAILLITAAFAMAELCLLLKDFRSTAKGTTAAIAEVRGAAGELRSYAAEQAARLRDPRNSKAIDAAIQTAAVFNGTGRLINKSVIPRVNTILDGLADSTASLDKLVQATNRSINAEITPEAVHSLRSLDDSLKATSNLVQEASGRANASLDDIHRLLSDPSWSASQQEALGILKDAHGITSDLDKATDQMPAIAADLEKISKTSGKFAKPLLIARIVSILGQIIPW